MNADLKQWNTGLTTSQTPSFRHRPFSKKFILESITIVVKENTLQFDNKFYKQIQGTAMGSKMAPT